MQRAIDLALLGKGRTSPNPMVGCVIVYQNKIIGEGWHKKAGEGHAEVNAINSVMDDSLLPKSTVYVTLEPCSHFGKTPPCSDLLIQKKVSRVVIACTDPNPEVAGKGIKKLEEAGINVTLGVLEREAVQLNKRFFTFHQEKRPYIILKWAQSADGFIYPADQKKGQFILSGKESKVLTHKWRAEEDAILVGKNTWSIDQPGLGVRHWYGKGPKKIVLGNITTEKSDVLIFNNNPKTRIQEMINWCIENNCLSVFVEGGCLTHQSFINMNFFDEVRIYVTPDKIHNGLKAPKFNLTACNVQYIGKDQLYTWLR